MIASSACASHKETASAARIARAAVAALYAELVCTPKPGLVTLTSCGSHRDMNAATLHRSLFTLRHYFAAIAVAGMRDAPFAELQRMGIDAETSMLKTTRGVNTHRGAIFTLGLLAAACGACVRPGAKFSFAELGVVVRSRWSDDLIAAMPAASSHGLEAAWRHGAGGARAEAALGFPTVYEVGLPALRSALAANCRPNRASLQCLFELIAVLEDTNLLHRGGAQGLRFAQHSAREFLAAGGVCRDGWRDHGASIGRQFVARNLSPGGSADLLAATWFVHSLEAPHRASRNPLLRPG